jgi:hypothetical protein
VFERAHRLRWPTGVTARALSPGIGMARPMVTTRGIP